MQTPPNWKYPGWYVCYGSDYKWTLYFESDGNYTYIKKNWAKDSNGNYTFTKADGYLAYDIWIWQNGFSAPSYCGKNTYAITSGWGIYGSKIYHFDSTGLLDKEY